MTEVDNARETSRPDGMTDRKLRLPDWNAWFRQHADHAAKDRDEYELHLAAHEWTLGSSLDINSRKDFESIPNIAVEPFAHQVEDAILFFRRLAPRGLIADDVGLGKTITAGLIAAELIERGIIESILVVCPKALLPQWEEELRSKFGIAATPAVGGDFRDLAKQSGWITTYATARNKIALIKERKFDLLILDEAHALRNLYSDPPPQTALRFRELMMADAARFVLMLTATPIQNRLWDVYSLLDICRCPQPNPLGTPQHFLGTFVLDHPTARQLRASQRDEFRRRVSEAAIRTRRADTNLLFPTREVRDERLNPLADESAFLREALETLLELPELEQMTHARTLMSSPWAAAAAFERAATSHRHTPALRQQFARLAGIGRSIRRSAKANKVVEFARQLQAAGGPSRLIVFTMRVETLSQLSSILEEEGFGEQISIFKGGQAQTNKKAVEDFMSDPPVRPILLSTDAGAVGLNLQAGNVVINYDLPWNPMLIEQRIGRVQRLGQKAEKVIVYNLVLKGTIEDRIVLRLMEKLNLFHQAIGEMEELLELTGFDDEHHSLEEVILELVKKAALQIDVEAQLQHMEQSRREAEEKLKEMREATEQVLKSIRPPDGEKRLEGLPRVEPRLPFENLVGQALGRQFDEVRPQGTGRFTVRKGLNWLTYQIGRRAAIGDATLRWVLPGTRHFEELTRSLRGEIAHHVLDATTVPTDKLHDELGRRAEVLGLTVEDIKIVNRTRVPASAACLKLTSKVSTDQYQTLSTVTMADRGHGVEELLEAHIAGTTTTRNLPPASRLEAKLWSQHTRDLEDGCLKAIENEGGIARFCEFYESRLSEELARLAEQKDLPKDAKRRGEEAIRFRFTPEIAAEPLSIAGLLYETVQGEIYTRGRLQNESVALPFSGVPLTGVVIDFPSGDGIEEPWVCPGRHLVPRADFVQCSVDGCTKGACPNCLQSVRVLEHCADCQAHVCAEHTFPCVSCYKKLCGDHALTLDIGVGYVCNACSVVLDDGRRVIADDSAVSAVSSRRGHRSEMAKSQLSDRWAFPGEFVACGETGRPLLPDETTSCAVSGRRVGIDLTERSAVSGQAGVREKMGRSAVSQHYFIPGEEVVCDETGDHILPSESGTCAYSGKRVRRDLLAKDAATGEEVLTSVVQKTDTSGAVALPSHLVASQKTGRKGLPTELRHCEICLLDILRDEGELCPESGRFACRDHFRSCEVTGKAVLPEGLAQCEVTGRTASRSLLSVCPDTNRRALTSLFERCQRTGVSVLSEALVVCSASGESVRKSLLMPCEITGRPALPDRLVSCVVTGKRVLPDVVITCPDTRMRLLPTAAVRCEESGALCAPQAVEKCSETGRRVRRSLLSVDEVTGQLVLPSHREPCQITGRRTVSANLATCTATGKRVLPELLAHCAASGRPVLPEALVRCDLSGNLVHPDAALVCPDTKQTIRRDRGVRCELSGVLVSPNAIGLCEVTGKHVRKSFLGMDAVSGKMVLSSLLRTCEETGRMTLPELLVRSAVSGKLILADIAAKCEISGAWALPHELPICSVTKKRVLPALAAVCSESDELVTRDLLKTCEASGRHAKPEFFAVCAVTGKTVLRRLLRASEISGTLALEAALAACEASGRRVLPSELETTVYGHRRVCRDRIEPCHVCGGGTDIGDLHACSVCGQRSCPDHHDRMCHSCRTLLSGRYGREVTESEREAIAGVASGFKLRAAVDSKLLSFALLQKGGVVRRRMRRLLVFPKTPQGIAPDTPVLVERDLREDVDEPFNEASAS